MRTSQAGIDVIKFYEGWSASVYRCAANYVTIGYGSCYDDKGRPISATANNITKERGESYLRYSVQGVEKAISRLVLTRAELTQGMFDATVSLTYNIGTGAFQRSTIRQRLIRGDFEGAADIWWQFRRGGGRILPGLVKRRETERQLFCSDW